MRKRHSIIIGQRRGIILLPDENRYVLLNPIERTLYRLFLSHPDGIPSDDLLASTVSRVKKKFVTALGARKTAPYIIRRSADGNYRTSARYLKGTV